MIIKWQRRLASVQTTIPIPSTILGQKPLRIKVPTSPIGNRKASFNFITFRLADSLPHEKLKIFTQEKEVWLNQNPEPHNSEQKAEYYERFVMRIQQWLDLGYGSMILRDKEAKSLVTNAIQYFNEERYKLDEYVVAANHVHVLLQVQKWHNLSDILHSWKSFTAKELLKLPVAKKLITAPKVWQKESWDHIVRSKHSLQKFREYIQAHSSWGVPPQYAW